MSMKKLRDQYRYSDWPERIPLVLKKSIKKVCKPNAPQEGIAYRSTAWVRRMSRDYTGQVKRRGRRRVESATIRSSHSYALLSYRTERLLQRLSSKRYYRFEDMMILLDPYNQAPLTAVALFYTKEPTQVRYCVKGRTTQADYTMTLPACQDHRVPILGLYAGTKNTIVMQLLDENGEVIKERTVTVTTKELPKNLKDVVSAQKSGAQSAFEMFLISGGLQINTCAFDQNGDIRWYLRRQTKAYGIFPLSEGRFLYMEKWVDVPSYSVSQSCMAYEMDYLGRIYKTYFYVNGFHHCAREKEPGGNILLGSNSFAGHDENVVIELDRRTGQVVDSLNMDDLFDDTYQSWTDWCHVNAVSYNAADHSVIVSMRNIHTVAKVNWDTKELVWLLANPKMWENTSVADKVLQPVGEVKWIYQQHAAYQLDERLDADTIQMIVYDNHWARRRPVEFYDGDEAHSYLSIFAINEKAHTVRMEHSVSCPNSRIRSNAIWEREAGRIFNMAGDLVPSVQDSKGMIEEYDYASGERINRWLVKPGFFTAYPFAPEAAALAAPLPEEPEYWQGSTISILPMDEPFDSSGAQTLGYQEPAAEEQERVCSDEEERTGDAGGETAKEAGADALSTEQDAQREKEIEIHFQEDVLFVKAVDHSISYIYFIGEQHRYYVDLTQTYQTMDIFRDKIYEIPFWLRDMQSDTYHIYYRYRDGLYDSQAEFTISEALY